MIPNAARVLLGLLVTTGCLWHSFHFGIWLSIIAFKTEFGTVEIEIPDGIDGIQVQLAQNGRTDSCS